MNDSQLIQHALNGDSGAFGQLVQRYQGRLYNTLFHVVGSREEAEDLVQDAFVQAYVKLSSFQGHSAFYTWLYRIAFNLSVSKRRRKRPEISVDQQREQSGAEPEDGSESAEQQVLREERAEQVYAALDRLPTEQRSILVLRELEGCCYESIAEILELPVGTVRSRLHRARVQLKSQLRDVLKENVAD